MGKHFGMLKASDMVQIDEEGRIIGGNKAAINAACHTHSPAGKAWSTFGRPLDTIN